MSTASDTLRHPVIPLARRVGKETVYLLVDLPIGVAGFSLALTGLVGSAALILTFFGVPMLAATLFLARRAAPAELWRARLLLGIELPPPRPLRVEATPLRRLLAPVRDGAAWRATGYFLLMLPVGVVNFTIAVTWWATALCFLTLPVWGWTLADGGPVVAGTHLTRPWQVAVSSLAGLALLLAAPLVTRGLTHLDRGLLLLLRDGRTA